ncbi:macro domain-containing protein [Catalinimonas niigatensis]|uniref:macro domain-containing protein n=1 Tax=Catalinimonas niigatensis TaxID=1397264 RepID=UPI002666B0CA|nr:macro domain-containing protein [Catalinimonas niigatensis]WPP48534.1 macro domain-containing protein [Catalinimonas niigatensis]
MEARFSEIKIEIVQGDISQQPDMEAIVNAANAELRSGGGVAGAIHRAAGPELEEACRPLAPISPGEAVITQAFQLPNQWVVHCLGPVYGRDKPEDQLLANCYKNALELAENHQVQSIAFPAISTGIFGYPLQQAARVMLQTIQNKAKQLSSVQHIRIVLYGEHDCKLLEQSLQQML